MKYKSNLISVASGSLAGTTFSHNRFGQYMRNRSTPVNPQSSRQTTVRTLLSDLTQLWGSTLTSTQRANWSNYAANVPVKNSLGDDIYLTGLNMYVRSNVALMQAGLTRVDDGPAILSLPGEDPTLAVTASEATQQLTIAYDDTLDWADDDGGALIVSCGLPQGTAINFFNGPWRFADSIDGDSGTPPTSPGAIAAPFTFQEDQQLFIRARIVRADGRLSNFFRASCTAGS
jgi:hypothetical protein